MPVHLAAAAYARFAADPSPPNPAPIVVPAQPLCKCRSTGGDQLNAAWLAAHPHGVIILLMSRIFSYEINLGHVLQMVTVVGNGEHRHLQRRAPGWPKCGRPAPAAGSSCGGNRGAQARRRRDYRQQQG